MKTIGILVVALAVLALLAVMPAPPASADGDSWVLTGSLSVPRMRQQTVLLADGKVLIAGGAHPGSYSSPLADLYDPSTGTWSPTGSMNYARHGCSMTLLPDGRPLAVGGVSANVCTGGPDSKSAEIYDPATGTWSLTGSMAVGRVSPILVTLRTGKVLVAGGGDRCGHEFASAELYDPASRTWSPTGSLNQARASYQGQAVLLPDGRVLAAGGRLSDGPGHGRTLRSFDRHLDDDGEHVH